MKNLEITAILNDRTEKYIGTYSEVDFMPDTIKLTISEIKKEQSDLFGDIVEKIIIKDQQGNLCKSEIDLPELR